MDVSKTGVLVSGVVWAVPQYVSKDNKTYWSVDLLVKDHRSMINIKLSPEYDRSKLVTGQVVSLPIKISSYKDNTFLTAI